jgi:hypothetical protein
VKGVGREYSEQDVDQALPITEACEDEAGEERYRHADATNHTLCINLPPREEHRAVQPLRRRILAGEPGPQTAIPVGR